MRRWIILVGLACLAQPPAARPAAAQDFTLPAQQADVCDVPGYLLFAGEAKLEEVAKAVRERRALRVLVVGTGSSALAAPGAYPGRLEEALKRWLPGVNVNVSTEVKPRLKAADMVKSLEKILPERKPDLVVWQTGTVDAMRGVDPDEFRHTLDEGVDAIHDTGADIVLMNMQYSPRTESVIPLASFADNMRVVARDRDIPLFDRLEIMRYWNDNGHFDLNTATRDSLMAQRVHECIGRALASLIVEAAHLDHMKANPSQ